MFSATQNPELPGQQCLFAFSIITFPEHSVNSIRNPKVLSDLTWMTDLECISKERKNIWSLKKRIQTLYLIWLLAKMWVSTKLLLWTPRQNRRSRRHTRTRAPIIIYVMNIIGQRLTHKKDTSHTLIQHQNQNSSHVYGWLTASWVHSSKRETW